MTTQSVVIVVVLVVVHRSASKSAPAACVRAELTVSNAVSLLMASVDGSTEKGRGAEVATSLYRI